MSICQMQSASAPLYLLLADDETIDMRDQGDSKVVNLLGIKADHLGLEELADVLELPLRILGSPIRLAQLMYGVRVRRRASLPRPIMLTAERLSRRERALPIGIALEPRDCCQPNRCTQADVRFGGHDQASLAGLRRLLLFLELVHTSLERGEGRERIADGTRERVCQRGQARHSGGEVRGGGGERLSHFVRIDQRTE